MSTTRKVVKPDNLFTDVAAALITLFSRSSKKNEYEVRVQTRDCKGAGTDCNIYISMTDKHGKKSHDFLLDNIFKDDMENGEENVFKFSLAKAVGDIASIELWRDGKVEDEWFCECIIVKHIVCNQTPTSESLGKAYPFPCHLWIKPNQRYHLFVYNCSLPQLDTIELRQQIRKDEIAEAKDIYRYESEPTGFPRRITELPANEMFSSDYQWDIKKTKLTLFSSMKLQQWFGSDKWDNFDDMLKVYEGTFSVPKGWYDWKSDSKFGWQRLNGLNTSQIKRCDKIPENFPVSGEMVSESLEGNTLDDVIGKRLFIVDLTWLEEIPSVSEEFKLPAPYALFYANDEGDLMPIAIQLEPIPSEENPIFLPSDPEYTWLLAKMYFNVADAQIHQATDHLGFTHLIVESIYCAIRQSLPTCHPVYQLFAPHFLYLVAINSVGLGALTDPGGYFDTAMSMGGAGFKKILSERWKNWRFDDDGWLPNALGNRGLADDDVLRTFHYRSDATKLFYCIHDYVTDVLNIVYDSPKELMEDSEIQNFAAILIDEDKGAGFKGVFGNGKFENLDDLISVVTATIFMGSVQHAAVNFSQYDEYAFPPAYPAKIMGDLPKDKGALTEKDIISRLPNKDETLSTMMISHLLSRKNTDSLGYFDIQYQYEPKQVEAVKRFQERLRKIGEEIDERNKHVDIPYTVLHPDNVPNAISI